MAADEGSTSGDATTAPKVEVGATAAKKTRRRVKQVAAQEEKVSKNTQHVATAQELANAKLDPLLKDQSLFTPQGRPRVQENIRCVRGGMHQPSSTVQFVLPLTHSSAGALRRCRSTRSLLLPLDAQCMWFWVVWVVRFDYRSIRFRAVDRPGVLLTV
jgi:hypothetical protein